MLHAVILVFMYKSHHTTYIKKCEKPDFAAVVGKFFPRQFVQLEINWYSTKTVYGWINFEESGLIR